MNIIKGQKVDITKGKNISDLIAVLEWETSNKQIEIDAAAFLLNESGHCKNETGFIFYGNPASIDGSVRVVASEGKRNEIQIDLKRISKEINKIAFTLTIHEGDKKALYFSEVSSAKLLIKNKVTGEKVYTFPFEQSLQKETAIVVGELYLHNGEWKLNAIGSGFYGGLPALCANFGIQVEEEISTTPAAEAIAVAAVKEIPQPKEVIKPLDIILKKKEKVSIKKSEKVVATLEWDTKKDLDLYCFYVTKDGEEGKIYYRNQGNAKKEPFITLDGDALVAGKETIIVHQPSQLKYVLFAAYSAVSNGIGSFKSMKARAVVDNQMGQRITSPLFENNRYAYWVAIAMIDFTDANEMKVSHVESYSKSGTERSPLLYKDGTFKMNVGPIEFK